MNIYVFLLCYNESALITHTINHYKTFLPSCKIIILDNTSTDNSRELATSLGCYILMWSSNNIQNEISQTQIKNNVWKKINDGWIIVADMDEFLCITESELYDEMNNGTTMISVKGIDMIGESKTTDLSDINLETIEKYVESAMESKALCFLRPDIIDMNYTIGAHGCFPDGNIKYSDKMYLNKHMNYLGLNFYTNKMINRYERTILMRKYGMGVHYINDIELIKNNYDKLLNESKILT